MCMSKILKYLVTCKQDMNLSCVSKFIETVKMISPCFPVNALPYVIMHAHRFNNLQLDMLEKLFTYD